MRVGPDAAPVWSVSAGTPQAQLTRSLAALPGGWYLNASITVLYASLRCFMPTRLVLHCCRIRFFSMAIVSISVVA